MDTSPLRSGASLLVAFAAGGIIAGPAAVYAAEPAPKRILLVKTQRHEGVPSVVSSRLMGYLETLLEMEGPVDVVRAAELTATAPPTEEVKVDKTEVRRIISRADMLLEAGKAHLDKRKYDDAIGELKKAMVLYAKVFADLEDFDPYVDAALNRSLAYFLAGFDDNGEDDLAKVLVLRPELVLDRWKAPKTATQALARLRALYSKSETGAIEVTSTPPGATIYLDGVLSGQTPAKLTGMFRGTHVIRVVADGHAPWAETREIAPGDNAPTAATLTPYRKEVTVAVEAISVEGLQAAAKSGGFSTRFRDAAASLATLHSLDGIVLTYVRRAPLQYEIAAFYFDPATKGLAELPWSRTDHELATIQVAALTLAEGIGKATAAFPTDLALAADQSSAIYSKAIPVAGPSDGVNAQGGPTGDTGGTGGTGIAITPDPDPLSNTVMRPGGAGSGGQSDLGLPEGQVGAGTDPGGANDGDAWYEQWWVWTLAVGVIGGGTAAILLLNDDSAGTPPGFGASVNLP